MRAFTKICAGRFRWSPGILASIVSLAGVAAVAVAAPAGTAAKSSAATQAGTAEAGLAEWQDEAGNWFAFDGVFYNFLSADSLQGIKLWVPPGDGPIRGVILHGNPGGGYTGDTRSKTRQRNLLEFAVRHRFGVAGVTGFPGNRVFGELAAVICRALAGWGGRGVHPELARVPLIATGGSNAGMFSFGMLCYAPERMIAITPNCGPIYVGAVTDAARAVPAWMHVGALDPLISFGLENTEALFAEHGPAGAMWAWDAEMKGHENGSADHVDLAYWDAIIPLRLPPEQPPRGEPVPLRPVVERDGWWVDHRSWDHVVARICPGSAMAWARSEPGRYGWLPDEGTARLYQAAATRSRPITISLVDGPAAGEGTRGVFLSGGENRVVSPGDTVRIKIAVVPLGRGIERIEIFDRTELLGTVAYPGTTEFAFTADGTKRLYALHARSRDGFAPERSDVLRPAVRHYYAAPGTPAVAGGPATAAAVPAVATGAPRVSNPLQIVVRDPRLSAAIEDRLRAVSLASRCRQPSAAHAAVADLRGDGGRPGAARRGEGTEPGELAGAGELAAIPLTPAFEADLRRDGRLSPIWATLREKTPPVTIDAKFAVLRDGKPGQRSGAGAGDRVLMQAAHGEAGLYLYFEVADNSWESGEGGVDQIDFHLASHSKAFLAAAGASPAVYTRAPVYDLLRRAVQIQVPVGAAGGAVAEVGVGYWDPWDPAGEKLAADQNFAGTGLWAEVIGLAADRRGLEMLVPWPLAGNPGLAGRPPSGSRLTLMVGYGDSGPDAKLCWPGGRDPWGQPAEDPGARLAVWGEILLR